MNKNLKLIIILLIPIIWSLIEWNISFSSICIIISMILIYVLISAKNISYKNKYTKLIYKIYRFVMMLFLSTFIILQGAITINFHRTSDVKSIENVNTMIILGAKVNEDGISKTLKRRLDKAIEYYNTNKNINNIIVSGGQGSDEVVTEALAMKNYLVKNGVSKDKIIMEDKATTTLENIIFSKKIITDKNLKGKVLIVTSDYHLFRGQFIASILGIDNEGLCSISPLSSRIYYMIREYPTSIIDIYRSLKISFNI
ncbi:MAG: YdcF family protein [Terrisporobacter sp.]|uniref:YdcF family protein n=1 Tax=Terrisporobacter sp. TaxID=1965305 RepID=UPI002F94ED03